jgi:glutamate synthase (NADPH/NADH) small chain
LGEFESGHQDVLNFEVLLGMNLTLTKSNRIRIIRVLSYLAFVYAGLGFFNQNFFHWTRSFWLSSYSEKIAIVVFGVWRVTQEKNAYTRRRIAILTFFITTIWILLPYLTGSSFFNHHLIGSFWFFAYLVIIFFFGRRADCSWNCPCVGIRDTAGDIFRSKTIRGSWLWKLRHLKWVFLVSLVGYLFLYLALPNSITMLKYARDFTVVNMGLYFASLLIVPWTGNRNYCRYLCPWGSLYGFIGKLGFFKVVADKEECLECDICEDICDMGVPILILIQEKGEINVADCVGCGRCVQECPTEALKLVDVRDALKSMFVS